MIVKAVVDEDFVNYKKPSMFIAFPKCTWKCEKECGQRVCQNGALATSPDIDIKADELIQRYMDNPITKAVVLGGLEPFDSLSELINFIAGFRKQSSDDIVIYTGYTEEEIYKLCDHSYILEIERDIPMVHTDCNAFGFIIKHYDNIIIKFGRYVPGQKKHYDDTLGVYLASDNQYAKSFNRGFDMLVLEQGFNTVRVCPRCGCVFIFRKTDTYLNRDYPCKDEHPKAYRAIDCPNCKSQIRLYEENEWSEAYLSSMSD